MFILYIIGIIVVGGIILIIYEDIRGRIGNARDDAHIKSIYDARRTYGPYHVGDFYSNGRLYEGMIVSVNAMGDVLRCVRLDAGGDNDIENIPSVYDSTLPTIEELATIAGLSSRFLELREYYFPNETESIFRKKNGDTKLYASSSYSPNYRRLFYDLEKKRQVAAQTNSTNNGYCTDNGEYSYLSYEYYRLIMFTIRLNENLNTTKSSKSSKKKKQANKSHGGCGIVIVLLLIIAAVAGGFYYYQQRQNTMTASSWFYEDEFSDESVADYETPTSTATDEVSDPTTVDEMSCHTSTIEHEIYDIADVAPDFPGSGEGLYHFIHDNLIYPQLALDNNITGTVHVTFVVEKDGQITNAEILHDIGGGCGEEALRLVNSMPLWTPAYVNGEPVRYQFNLYVPF